MSQPQKKQWAWIKKKKQKTPHKKKQTNKTPRLSQYQLSHFIATLYWKKGYSRLRNRLRTSVKVTSPPTVTVVTESQCHPHAPVHTLLCLNKEQKKPHTSTFGWARGSIFRSLKMTLNFEHCFQSLKVFPPFTQQGRFHVHMCLQIMPTGSSEYIILLTSLIPARSYWDHTTK